MQLSRFIGKTIRIAPALLVTTGFEGSLISFLDFFQEKRDTRGNPRLIEAM
jgi:hypothetical protein